MTKDLDFNNFAFKMTKDLDFNNFAFKMTFSQ